MKAVLGEQCAWKANVTTVAILTGIVFFLNLGLTLWVAESFPVVNAIATVFEGDCAKVTKWDTLIHLAINVVGILLLGGSNYTMQCLVSPTRKEIDRAHEKGESIDIGTPGIANLTRIDWKRAVIWILLALSSIPLALV